MREIKFRAWDKKGRFMFYPEYIGLNDANCKKDMGDTPDAWELMQFTGLKDKNSKEIYEGDIVKLNSQFYPSDDYEVRWSRGCFEIHSEKLVNTEMLSDYYGRVEIIGNIYENPELVK